MRQVVSVVKGGGPCTADCPFYEAKGWVRGVRGVPLKTHCRATMEAISVDCDIFNTLTVEKMEVTDAEWETMQKAIGKKAKKERKPYPEDHKEIHAVGCDWTRGKGKWNAQKSSNIKHGASSR